jgi:phosphonate transport system substrate-binding protein
MKSGCTATLRLALALVLLFSPVVIAKGGQKPVNLSFGVVPQQSASKLAGLWTPILAYLSRKTGYTIHFKTAKDIPTFERRLAAGDYDLAYMNPYHYTVFSQGPGYRVFAAEKGRMLTGVIVVRRDSVYQDIAELDGQTVAFPAPAAFAASLLIRAQLKNMGMSVLPKYVSSHDSVYHAIAMGLYPAGGAVVSTFDNLDPAVREKLRIVWRTKEYSPHAIASHARVSDAAIRSVQQAMLEMNQDPQGRALLGAVNFQGIRRATDGEYDDVRALKIGLLDKLIKANNGTR